MFRSGSHQRHKVIGRVAYFCVICREMCAFQMRKVEHVQGFMGVRIWDAQTLGFVVRCVDCGFQATADPVSFKRIAKEDVDDIEQLVEETYPSAWEDWEWRLGLEVELLKLIPEVDPELRLKLIREPFEDLAPWVEDRFGEENHFDSRSTVGCIVTLLLSFVLFMLLISIEMQGDNLNMAMGVSCVVGLIGLCVTMVMFSTSNQRWLDRVIAPMAARSLQPLHPSEAEISVALEELATMDFHLGRRLKPSTVMKCMAANVH